MVKRIFDKDVFGVQFSEESLTMSIVVYKALIKYFCIQIKKNVIHFICLAIMLSKLKVKEN